MKKIVIDTSAIIAVILNEPEREKLIELTKNSILIAPYSVHWEIGNALSAMFKRKRIKFEEAKQAIQLYKQIPIKFIDIDLIESLEMAKIEGMYAYDAYLLLSSKNCNAPLLTLDKKLIEVAQENKIKLIEV